MIDDDDDEKCKAIALTLYNVSVYCTVCKLEFGNAVTFDRLFLHLSLTVMLCTN